MLTRRFGKGIIIMFTTIFWILAIWLVVNGVWTCFATDNQDLMKWLVDQRDCDHPRLLGILRCC